MSAAEEHIPVLVDRVLALLAPALDRPDAILVDGTLGLAGHASALLAEHPGLHLIGIDRDPSALERSRARLEPYAGRVTLVHAVYDEIPDVLAAHPRDTRGRGEADGVLLDLGVSSPQLDEGERGFAYSYDAPLDMRMDTTQELTAAEVVNDYSERELTRILRTYGEERNAGRVAKAIVRERARTPITSTARLAEIVRDAIPAPAKRTGGNPAKRTFQGLRIEVNGELEVLERAVPAAIGALALDGRMAALSYHSLEDRLVKRAFAERSTDTTPHGLPVSLPDRLPELSLLTRGAERPDDEEIRDNPRAASARLRAVRRVRTGGGGA